MPIKANLGGRKLTKRKINKEIRHLKNFKNETLIVTKDICQIVNDKLNDTRSSWYGADVLYIVEVFRKGKIQNNSLENIKMQNHKLRRYLIILNRKDSESSFTILLVNCKNDELDLKSSFDPKYLRAIDFGSDENEMLLTFENLDQNIFFANQDERDETVWIILQLCRCILGTELSTSYSIDADALYFKMTTSGTLTRFPVLQKLISGGSTNMGDMFNDEETEAEYLLDELKWTLDGNTLNNTYDNDVTSGDEQKQNSGFSLLTAPATGQADLQMILTNQSEQLNYEIIDFLLQWEEMDEITYPVTAPEKAMSTSVTTTTSVDKSATAAVTVSVASVRDTREVLTALSLVNSELEAVDCWLGEQIERLSEIQANLRTIEDESGALETSWQNLNTVQQIIGAVVGGYSIDKKQSDLLSRTPEDYFAPITKSNATSLSMVPALVDPLVATISVLRGALDLKTGSSNSLFIGGCNSMDQGDVIKSTAGDHCTKPSNSSLVSPAQWKQIQAIAAVVTQRAKLVEMADIFCDHYGSFFLCLFDMLLRHKALTEGPGPVSICVKQFNVHNIILNYVTGQSYSEGLYRKLDIQQNQLLLAQQLFHSSAYLFHSVIDALTELSPIVLRPLCEAYIKATHERLFHPLVKTLVKDLNSIVGSQKVIVKLSLANSTRFQLDSIAMKNTNMVTQHFHSPPTSSTSLTSWMALHVALLILAPTIEAEERFLKDFFHLDSRSHIVLDEEDDAEEDTVGGVAKTTNQWGLSTTNNLTLFSSSRLCIMLDSIFEGSLHRIETSLLHCANGEGAVDGAEVVAMLTVLYQIYAMYPHISPFTVVTDSTTEVEKIHNSIGSETSSTMSEIKSDESRHDFQYAGHQSDNLMFLSKTLRSFCQSLVTRLNVFISEQIAWINSQKCDPKSAAVTMPFAKYPSFVLQVKEMANHLAFTHVDDLLFKVAKELFNWLGSNAKQSEKYSDKLKITNFTFFEQAIQPMDLPILDSFVTYACQQRMECMNRYVSWMVSYEFPALSALAVRMDGLGDRVNEEELSLYIRRKDVLNVVKEVAVVKTLENNIVSLRRRIEKHFHSDKDSNLNLVTDSWSQLKERVVRILTRLDEAASVSYQIQLDVGPILVAELFDKFSISSASN